MLLLLLVFRLFATHHKTYLASSLYNKQGQDKIRDEK
jgi:hypothetical protein